MDRQDDPDQRIVRAYHARTKHRPDRFAASLGYLDWANQPDPFRTFTGSGSIDLPRPAVRPHPAYDALFDAPGSAARLDAAFVGRLFLHSLALSAWKQAPGAPPWSLRINPSSGDLHPTEGYLVSGPVPGLTERPGIFHYAPFSHRLERRGELSTAQWQTLTARLPSPCLLVGLSSIHWREAWKYGERAFRYCHHDVGHAIGALAFAARTLGWNLHLLDAVATDDLERLLGTHTQHGVEAEHADCLLLLQPADVTPPDSAFSAAAWHARIPALTFAGEPNTLSADHQDWPVIDEVAQATRTGSVGAAPSAAGDRVGDAAGPLATQRDLPAEALIRQRRSAVAMDGQTPLAATDFFRMLARTLPGGFPFATLPWPARVSLAVFVHRVDGLDPGLYLLLRDPAHEPGLRQALGADLAWERPAGCPPALGLYRLIDGDARQAAKLISCDQAIAADGAFALGMLAAFDAAIDDGGAACYPRLYWECGLIGQLLYLEAEAAGVRATGIGCFFDDLMHELLGIRDQRWQSLYHFTVGGPVDDDRLQSLAPYAHLEQADGG